ncbi:MAG: hypothetical protein KTV16_12635 [Acidimicrobiia bacterium]|nr:hypothetical protein [Acidimicrobiia bacterium]
MAQKPSTSETHRARKHRVHLNPTRQTRNAETTIVTDPNHPPDLATPPPLAGHVERAADIGWNSTKQILVQRRASRFGSGWERVE